MDGVTVSVLGALAALVVAIVLILKKVQPTYAMLIGAVAGGLIGGAGLTGTVNYIISGTQGIVSAIIAFLRTIVFECGAVLLLPLILGIDGIWLSVSVGELAAAALATCFMIAFRNRYGYGKRGAARQ